jgi:hypothetical protein
MELLSNRSTADQDKITSTRGRADVAGFQSHFHRRMALAMTAFAAITFGGCWTTGIWIPGWFSGLGAFILLLSMALPLLLFCYRKGKYALVDGALLILWAWLESHLIPDLLRAAARLRLPLRDNLFGIIDQHLRFNVHAIQTWSLQHPLGRLITWTYGTVGILIPAAVILPLLIKQHDYVRRLVVANLVSFTVGVPLFALLPAIGPWQYFHSIPTHLQYEFCEAPFVALRASGTYILTTQPAGIICFPSFHVVWAVLCGASLWCFRYLRPFLVVLCAMIVLSTMTTGWHYFTDVLGGLALSAVSLLAAQKLLTFGHSVETEQAVPTRFGVSTGSCIADTPVR